MWQRLTELAQKSYLHLRPLIFLGLALLFGLSLYWQLKLQQFNWEGEPLTSVPAEDVGFTINPGALALVASEEQELKLSITGAVESPGVYTFSLEQNAVVADLLQKAGGLSREADKLFVAQNINLAKDLQPSEHIYIPSLEERKLSGVAAGGSTTVGSSSGSGAGVSQNAEKVNLNTATQSELESLPGVGPATSEKIIQNRPYSTPEDLMDVSGIGEATFAKLKDQITI